MNRDRMRAVMLAVPVLWGIVFIGVERVLRQLDAFQLVAIRFTMISALFGLLMVFTPSLRPRLDRRGWLTIAAISVLGVPAAQLTVVYAQNFIHPALASLFITLAPAVTAMLAPFFLPERVDRRQAIGIGVALMGSMVIIITGAGDASFDRNDILGAAIGLGTPVAWALFTIQLKRISGQNPLGTIGLAFLVGTIYLTPFYPTAFSAIGDLTLENWLWLGYLAFFGTFLATIIWFWSLKYLSTAETSAYIYLVPVSALITSFIVLREGPPPVALGGGVLVIIGVALTQRSGRVVTEAPVVEP